MGASLLALAKSIYYHGVIVSTWHNNVIILQ